MSQLERTQTYFALPYVKEVPRALQSRLLTFAFAVSLDFLSIQIGAMLGVLCYELLFRFNTPRPYLSIFTFSMEYVLIFSFFAYKRDLYKHTHSLLYIRETAETLRISTLCVALIGLSIYLHRMVVPRLMLLFCWLFTTMILLVQKHLSREIILRWKSRQVKRQNVLIIGVGPEARRIFSILTKSPDLGLLPVALVGEEGAPSTAVVYGHDYHFRDAVSILNERVDASLLERMQIKEVYVAEPTLADERVAELIRLGAEMQVPISFVGNKSLPGSNSAGVRFLDGLHITSMVVSEKRDLLYTSAKRVFDIVAAGLLILLTAPVWVAVALWIRLSSPGPIFFRQTRIAQEGRPFQILKFRSMYVTAPKYGVSPDSSFDPRVTSAGRFLRKSSLDELPQLLNVLMGDMSLVGPRPEMPFIVENYTHNEHQRLLVPQGMTGFWQLSADRKLAIHERLEYDLYYLEQKGFFFDLAILCHTALFAMKGI